MSGSGGAERCNRAREPVNASHASMPVAMPARTGLRSGRAPALRYQANATAAGRPTHHRKPPSPMAMIDIGAATYSGHQPTTNPSRAASRPTSAASMNRAPATLCGESGSRLAQARTSSQPASSDSATMTALMGKGPSEFMRSTILLQVADLEALLEPVEDARARQGQVPLAAAVDQHARVEGVDDAGQLGLEAVLRRCAAQFGGDVPGHGLGLQVGLVGLLGHPVRTRVAARDAGHVDLLHAARAAAGLGGDEAAFRQRQFAALQPGRAGEAGHE